MKPATTDPGSPLSLRSGRRPFPWTSKPRLNNRPSFNVLGSRSAPISDDQAFQLAVDAVRKALETQQHTEKQTALDTDINHGMTINLGGKKIGALTDKIINVLPREVQRLALPENMLSSIPLEFSTFSSLRYLNARDNCIKVFPSVVFVLPQLEILDLSLNKIQTLPDDISRLKSLKVLAVRENLLEEIPPCIADMALLQVFKAEGNPLNDKLRRIMTSHRSSKSEPASLAEIAVTTRIKQYLKDKNPIPQYLRDPNPSTLMVHPMGEVRYKSNSVTDTTKHPSRSSRSGRFPVKVRDSHSQPVNPPPSPIAFHSKAFSQQSFTPRSPCLIPPTITEVGDSLPRSSPSLSIDTRINTRINTGNLNPATQIKSPPWKLPQSPITIQRPRRVSFSAEPHRPVYQERTSSIANSGRRNVLTALAVQPSRPLVDDPLLGMARTLYLSINQLHLPLQALAGLASDGRDRRSTLEVMVEKATFDLNILGQLIQKHSRIPTQHGLEEADINIIRRTCADLINSYMIICSQVVANLDKLVERGDPRFIRNLVSLMYSSVMSFRGEFMQNLQNDEYDFGKTIRPDAPSRAQTGLGINEPRTAAQPATVSTSETPPIPRPKPAHTLVPEPRQEGECLDLLQNVLHRSCKLILDTLPSLNQQLELNLAEIVAQGPKPQLIEIWQLLLTACTRMIEQARSLEKHLPAVRRGDHIRRRFWSVCYEYVEAWTQLGGLIKSTHQVVEFSSESLKLFQQIQRSVKEVTSLTMNPRPAPPESPTTPHSDVSLSPASTPITPLQASLGPAIEIISLHSP